MSDAIPSNLRYSKEHEWARLEDDGTITIGITAHAVEQLGDITMVTLPETDTAFDAGDSFGDIDSVKAVSELFAPLTGTVRETNSELEASPELVNEDPYGKGWMLKVAASDAGQLEGLMDAAAYENFLAEA
ncbi:MAG: glycine cleavage system protein GcvH [Myxococcales bacterium FL481]|nr:MAG: glycine cleavage system protein GcvH [Myxococcales bacterium FL481]